MFNSIIHHDPDGTLEVIVITNIFYHLFIRETQRVEEEVTNEEICMNA